MSMLTSDMKNDARQCGKPCKEQKNEYGGKQVMIDVHDVLPLFR